MRRTEVTFHSRLHHWYKAHGRKDLPWRNTADPYAIYISEIMLQQTQVKTVLERYYFQFLKRFPTLPSLAAAKQNDVLHAWQGLGYYNRAINLHKAAKEIGIRDWALVIREGKNPLMPDAQSLIPYLTSLPGIGRNTAHAIAAFAYHQPVAVMEANVRRVLARIFALPRPNENDLWNKAEALLDRENPFDYNQAMMDIGALVCTKRAPRCNECPAQDICNGKQSPESYPAPKIKKAVPIRKKHIVILQNPQGKYFAAPRRTKFLNGLYHFTEFPSPLEGEDVPPHNVVGRERGYLNKGTLSKIPPLPSPPPQGGRKYLYLGNIRQQYSHFTLEADVWLKQAKRTEGENWYTLAQLKKLPVSMAEKKIIALVTGYRS